MDKQFDCCCNCNCGGKVANPGDWCTWCGSDEGTHERKALETSDEDELQQILSKPIKVPNSKWLYLSREAQVNDYKRRQQRDQYSK